MIMHKKTKTQFKDKRAFDSHVMIWRFENDFYKFLNLFCSKPSVWPESTSTLYFFLQQPLCSNGMCLGSVMSQSNMFGAGSARTRDEVTAMAKDFIQQYYTSIKRWVRIAFGKVLWLKFSKRLVSRNGGVETWLHWHCSSFRLGCVD